VTLCNEACRVNVPGKIQLQVDPSARESALCSGRRYRSDLRNFLGLYQALTTTWRMYDDSVPEPLLIASAAGTETLAAIHHVEASSAR